MLCLFPGQAQLPTSTWQKRMIGGRLKGRRSLQSILIEIEATRRATSDARCVTGQQARAAGGFLLAAECVPTRRLRCVAEGSCSGRTRRKSNGALRCPGWRAGPGWRALCERARQAALLSCCRVVFRRCEWIVTRLAFRCVGYSTKSG